MIQKIMKNKLIVVAILVFVIIGLAVFSFREPARAPAVIDGELETMEEVLEVNDNKQETINDGQGVMNEAVGVSAVLTKEDLWKIWIRYLGFAKEKNIEGIKSISYQVSEACTKPELKGECEEKMTAVYTAGSVLRKEDFNNISADSKQAILRTNLKIEETVEAFTATEGKIVFALNPLGKMSLLHLDPAQTWSVRKKTGSTTEEMKTRLYAFSKDTDVDGLSDELEKCIFPDEWIVLACTETNPNKRDSDGDGWWDGVEYYFLK